MVKKGNVREREFGDPMLTAIAVQLRAVLGEGPLNHDVILVGSYEDDLLHCETAIREAQAELNEAGEGTNEKEGDVEVALAWHKLDSAYHRLATVKARQKLALRRGELKVLRERRGKRAI